MRGPQVFQRGVAALAFESKRSTLVLGKGSKLTGATFRPRKSCSFALGEESIFGARLDMDADGASVIVGPRSFVGRSHLVAAQAITIGADVMISWGATIVDHQSHSMSFRQRSNDVKRWSQGEKDWGGVVVDPVRIGDKCWIGLGAIVLPGVSIGEGAIVGAGAVVTHDVDPWTIVAGNPARVIRRIDDAGQEINS